MPFLFSVIYAPETADFPVDMSMSRPEDKRSPPL
jgi:hypothetical protein